MNVVLFLERFVPIPIADPFAHGIGAVKRLQRTPALTRRRAANNFSEARQLVGVARQASSIAGLSPEKSVTSQVSCIFAASS